MECPFDVIFHLEEKRNLYYFALPYRKPVYRLLNKYSNKLAVDVKGTDRLYVYFSDKERDHTGKRYVYSLAYVCIFDLPTSTGSSKHNVYMLNGRRVIGELTLTLHSNISLNLSSANLLLSSSNRREFYKACEEYSSIIKAFMEKPGLVSNAFYGSGNAVSLSHRAIDVPIHGLKDIPMSFFFYYACRCDWMNEDNVSAFLVNIVKAVLMKWGKTMLEFTKDIETPNLSEVDIEILCDCLKFVPRLLTYTPDRNGENFSIAWAMAEGLKYAQMDCEDFSLLIGFIFHLFTEHTQKRGKQIAVLVAIQRVFEKKTLVHCLLTSHSGEIRNQNNAYSRETPQSSHMVPVLMASPDWRGQQCKPWLLECMGNMGGVIDKKETKKDLISEDWTKPWYSRDRASSMVYIDLFRMFKVEKSGRVTELIPFQDEQKKKVGVSFLSFLAGTKIWISQPMNQSESSWKMISNEMQRVPWRSVIPYDSKNGNNIGKEAKCKNHTRNCRTEWFMETPELKGQFDKGLKEGVISYYSVRISGFYVCDGVYASLIDYVL
jgi:hypothetical protein